jgi:protocatechuate 3,4-dioxygenase beta subunit
MRVEDFPRPKNDNRRGVHWSASVYHPSGSALDFWIGELEAMHVKWLKLLDDSGGSSLEVCERLLAADIMPIVRLYRQEPNPGHIGGREEDTIRRMVAAGVRYFETNNEPDLPVEWQGDEVPANWLEIAIDNFIIDADKVIALGGLPALPAMGVGSKDNPVELVVRKGRADLFEKGAWIAIHNYTLNHPLEYPYDAVNQAGEPVSQEEYDRLGPWAWEGQPRDLINEWRASDKNPDTTLADDSNCFLAFALMDQFATQALGHKVPIISTEGGPVMGWRDDRRYPRVDPMTHADWITAIYDFMQGGCAIRGMRCPGNYFALCHWLLGNYRMGYLNPGWESQAWYTDWWNGDFKLSGELPVVAAVKGMPSVAVDGAQGSVIAGRVLRADTGAPLADVEVKLLADTAEVATCTSAADGTFRFEHLDAGAYDVVIEAWGVVARGVVAEPEPAQSLTFRLSGGNRSVLAGQLLDHTGAAQAGASVALHREGMLIGETTAAADGTFRFAGLTLGNYQLTVPGITVAGIALDGWAAKTLKLTTRAPSGYRYAVTTQRLLPEDETAGRRIFYGVVSDQAGNPVNGIQVEMSWHNSEPGTEFPVRPTGHDPYKPAGSYDFVHTPGLFRLQVVQGDWPSDVADSLDTANVPGREGQAIAYEVNFRLQSGAADKARVDGVMPGAQPGTKLALVGTDLRREATLAADGSFAFPDLAPGTYSLEMAGIGTVADAIQLQDGGLYKLLFPLRSKLSGQVLNQQQGLSAILYAPPGWGWTRQAVPDPDGGFSFEGLPPGRYRLEVGSEVLSGLQLTGANSMQLAPIDLSAGSQSVIGGRVADGSGNPQADIQLILRLVENPGQEDGLIIAQMRTSADGTYRFSSLPAGRYSLEAVGMGTVAADVLLDGQHEVTRDLLWNPPFPLGIIQGRVLAGGGLPRPGLQVILSQDGIEQAHTRTGDSGLFRFAGLAPGSYTVAVPGGPAPLPDILLESNGVVVQDIVVPDITPKTISRYLLLSPAPAGQPYSTAGSLRRNPYGSKPIEDGPSWEELAESRLALALTTARLHKTGETAGFSSAEAAQAAEVILMGDRIPETIEQALQLAGCQVNRLGGSGTALADSVAATGEASTAPLEAETEPPSADVSAPVPAAQKSLGHYVLFGPPGHPATLANLLLAQDYLLAFSPCFGFAAAEASVAGVVTIVGDTIAVSQQVEDNLREGGATVQRVSGSVGEVAAALTSRIAAGRPLV